MKITRTSILTGKTRVKEIDVTAEQLREWSRGCDIHIVMSNIDKADREFIITGTIPEEWKTFCPG